MAVHHLRYLVCSDDRLIHLGMMSVTSSLICRLKPMSCMNFRAESYSLWYSSMASSRSWLNGSL